MKRTPLKRKTPMSRGSKPMKRGKRLGPGKKTLAKREAIGSAILAYFARFGWYDDNLDRVAPCQISGRPIRMEQANFHHKKTRAELRKAKVEDLDAPHQGVVCHYLAHIQFVHGGQMGRPRAKELPWLQQEADAFRRFRIVENSTASAENGEQVVWSDQDRDDLDRLMGGL